MAVDVGSAVGYLDLDISGFLANLKSAQSEADAASKNIATKIGKNLSGVGQSLTTVGSTLTKTVTTPVALAGGAVLKLSSDFEYSMSKVQAISGAVGEDFTALRDQAIDLGASTAFSASEVAEGMTEMAKAGWDTQAILDGMSGVLDAAAASGENLANVSTIMADAITGFGLEAGEATRVANLLTQAANSGTIDIADLGESFKYVAPVAQSMGFEIEDVTTALSAMSMAGIKGSQAGTALRTMLTNLVKPSESMATAMEELGIEAANADGSMKSLDEIVTMLRSSFNGLTDEQKSYYAATLAGKEGMSGLLSLLELTQEEYDAISDSMYNCKDVAKNTAEVMQNNLKSQVEQLVGSLESLAIQIGDIVLPHVKQFVDKVQALVDWFTNLSEKQKEQVIKWAAIAAAIGPVLFAVGKVISGFGGMFTTFGKIPGAIKTVTTGFTKMVNSIKNVGEAFTLAKAGYTGLAGSTSKLGTALAGVTGSMIAIVAVIGVLVAAFVTLWKSNEEFRTKIVEIWTGIKETVAGFCDGIVERINSLGFNFQSVTEVLSTVWQGFCELLAPLFTGAFQLVADTLSAVLDALLGLLDIFIGLFTGDWDRLWAGVQSYFGAVWNWIVNTFTNVGNTLKGILDVICGWFGTTWDATWTKIKTVASNALNAVKSTISTGFNAAKSTVASVLDGIKSKFTSIWDSCTSIVSKAIDKLKSFLKFEWSLPKLKLPHFTISGSFSLNPLSVPKFGISWYKAAMEDGMILNSPTIFGYNAATGQFLAGGEAGSETVVGTKSLLKMIKSAVAGSNSVVLNSIEDHFNQLYRNFNKSSRRLVNVLAELLAASNRYTAAVNAIASSNKLRKTDSFDYATLAAYLAEEFRRAPVQPHIDVEFKDGDVFLDNERVGRKVAPVVSRVVAKA